MTSRTGSLARLCLTPRSVLAAMKAEGRGVLRDKALLVMLLFLPLLYAVTVGYLYGRETVVDAPVVVVDQDGSQQASRLVWLIDATQEARVVDRVESVDEAFARLRRHEASAVLFVPEGFEARLLRKEPAKLKLWIDSANMLTYGTAYTGIRAAIAELDNERSTQAFIDKRSSRRQAENRTSPIEITERLLFHPTGSYGGFMAPAVFVVALQQAILLAFAISAGSRREKLGRADYERPHAYLRLCGRYLAHLPFHLMSAAAVALLIGFWYQFPAGNTVGVFALLSVFTLCMAPVAILVSLPFRNGQTPMQVLMLVSTPLFLASGYTWPLSQMPRWIQFVASLAPSTPTLAGLSSIGVRSGHFENISASLVALATLFGGYAVAGLLAVSALSWVASRRRRIADKRSQTLAVARETVASKG